MRVRVRVRVREVAISPGKRTMTHSAADVMEGLMTRKMGLSAISHSPGSITRKSSCDEVSAATRAGPGRHTHRLIEWIE